MKKGTHNVPDVMIPGMPRGGTTYLYNVLMRHPQVYVPKIKEVGFFLESNFESKGEEWYYRLFEGVDSTEKIFDVSTSLFTEFECAIPKIQNFLPGVKMIIPVRDPAECAVSIFYQHHLTKIIPQKMSFIDWIEGVTIDNSLGVFKFDLKKKNGQLECYQNRTILKATDNKLMCY